MWWPLTLICCRLDHALRSVAQAATPANMSSLIPAQKFKAATGIPVYKWSVASYDACVAGLKQVVAAAFDDEAQQRAHARVVLDDQDGARRLAHAGRETTKVLPRPTSLSTRTEPPCSSARLRTM